MDEHVKNKNETKLSKFNIHKIYYLKGGHVHVRGPRHHRGRNDVGSFLDREIP